MLLKTELEILEFFVEIWAVTKAPAYLIPGRPLHPTMSHISSEETERVIRNLLSLGFLKKSESLDIYDTSTRPTEPLAREYWDVSRQITLEALAGIDVRVLEGYMVTPEGRDFWFKNAGQQELSRMQLILEQAEFIARIDRMLDIYDEDRRIRTKYALEELRLRIKGDTPISGEFVEEVPAVFSDFLLGVLDD